MGAEGPVSVGVGFIGWVLEKTEEAEDPRIRAVLEEKVVAIWLAFGSKLGHYVEQIRAYDAKREHKTVVFTIVNSVEEALRAANEWKVDVVVAQGKSFWRPRPININPTQSKVSNQEDTAVPRHHHY